MLEAWKTRMKSRIRSILSTKYLIATILLLLAIIVVVWVCTGGISIQKVQGFHSIESTSISSVEKLDIRIDGTLSRVDVPFIIASYNEHSPFFLNVVYENTGEKTFETLIIKSAKVKWQNNDYVQLVNSDIAVGIQEENWPGLSKGELVNTRKFTAKHKFKSSLQIQFSTDTVVSCELEIELVGKNDKKTYCISRSLKGRKSDVMKTYWEHIADC
jgi:hypothetical protein